MLYINKTYKIYDQHLFTTGITILGGSAAVNFFLHFKCQVTSGLPMCHSNCFHSIVLRVL